MLSFRVGLGVDIWRNGPYIGGHLAFLFQIEFYINSKNTKNWAEFDFYFSLRCKYATLYKNQDKNLITIAVVIIFNTPVSFNNYNKQHFVNKLVHVPPQASPTPSDEGWMRIN